MAIARAGQLLSDYIAIPSVNPMGRADIAEDIAGEERYARHVQEQLRRLGVDAELIGSGARRSVVAEIRVQGARDTVMIASHLDTVPVDGMTVDPFTPLVRDDRLYGRGACDTKGGMAALLSALEHLMGRGKLRRNVVLVGEADEEMASRGVQDVLAHLASAAIDWALVTEPTELRMVTHHKGRVSAKLIARGRACHSSDPGRGDNAIVTMARVVLGLQALNEELSRSVHDLLGPATLSVGVAGGGQAPNIVPDEAWAVIDRRTLPDETLERVRAQLLDVARQAGVLERIHIDHCTVDKEPLATDPNDPSIADCRRALVGSGLSDGALAVAFGTDAGPFSKAGIPSVVIGPGSIDKAHTADEFVPLADLEAMHRFFVRLLS